jgi:hypothetical protein
MKFVPIKPAPPVTRRVFVLIISLGFSGLGDLPLFSE